MSPLNQRRSNVSGQKVQSWEPLEPLFQLLLPVFFGERKADSEEEKRAIEQIRLALASAASRIFRSPRMRGNDCDPQVAVQNWFIAIRAGKYRYKRGKPFHKYAYGVLSNGCCSLGRRAKVRSTQQIPFSTVSWTPTPPERAVEREERRRLRRALCALKRDGTLSGEQHAAIVYKSYWGLSSKEAGERCGVSAATIDRWAHQARKILRRHFRKGA